MSSTGQSVDTQDRFRIPSEPSPDPLRKTLDDAVSIAFEEPAAALPPAAKAISDEQPMPARMLNEFVYCPRLFYYEQVEGLFVENADTMRGTTAHKRVDAGNGSMPSPTKAKVGKKEEAVTDSEDQNSKVPVQNEIIHSRSVTLSSDRLGVIAKMDLVESRQDITPCQGDLFDRVSVRPVDYKVGAPREGDEGKELWDTDRMQLALQCLILRDNGYDCQEGMIYYRETRQRVPLAITPELEAWVLERIHAARSCSTGPIPPPLRDSPKCPRCSLVTICLPDETRMLDQPAPASPEASPEIQPRRLMAARDDTRALYLNTPGLHVGRTDEVLMVREKKQVIQEVRISDLQHVSLFGNIQISTQAIQLLCERDIPLTFFSMGGWFYGITRGHSLKNVFLRLEQFRHAADPMSCLRLARAFVAGKIKNHRTMLMRNHTAAPAPALAKLKNAIDTAWRCEGLESLLGVEGAAAALYFQHFDGMLKADRDALDKIGDDGESQGAADSSEEKVTPRYYFDFTGRNRRPPTDPVNALLSLAYSLLAKDCTIAAYAVGFDPYVGFYHQPRFGRPALALDVMEEFRPLVAESTVLTAINNRVMQAGDFVTAGRAVNLTTAGRRRFFETYEQRMSSLVTHPVFDYKVSYRRALELQFRILAKVLTGEIPEYVPFVTR